jgi:hypothetical protein
LHSDSGFYRKEENHMPANLAGIPINALVASDAQERSPKMLHSKLQRGERAPGFKLADGHGKMHDYPGGLGGRWVVLVFFRGNW